MYQKYLFDNVIQKTIIGGVYQLSSQSCMGFYENALSVLNSISVVTLESFNST